MMELMKKFTSVVEALADEGISTYIDSTTQEVSLERTGMGKQRWAAHISRIDQEMAALPDVEITGSASSAVSSEFKP